MNNINIVATVCNGLEWSLVFSVYTSFLRQNGVRTFQKWRQSFGQRRESFLHKVKIVLETREVNKKLMKNSQIS